MADDLQNNPFAALLNPAPYETSRTTGTLLVQLFLAK